MDLIKLCGFLLFFGIIGFAGWYFKKQNFKKEIYVHIEGEINAPGHYKVASELRIGELIDKAGGLTPRADMRGINLTQALSDGQKIIIPVRKSIFEKIGLGKGPEESYINPPVKIGMREEE